MTLSLTEAVMKANFKMCEQNQVTQGIVISYFSQREAKIDLSAPTRIAIYKCKSLSNLSLLKKSLTHCLLCARSLINIGQVD